MSAEVILSAAAVCLLGGVVPWISTEAVVVGACLLLPSQGVPVLVVAVSLAQMAAKTGLYGAARWAPHRLPRKARAALQKTHRLVAGRPRRTALILLTSATVGVPPFYLTTLAAGAVGTPVAWFLSAGGTGVVLRTGAVAWVARTTLSRRNQETSMRTAIRPVPARSATSPVFPLAVVVALAGALPAPTPLAAQAARGDTVTTPVHPRPVLAAVPAPPVSSPEVSSLAQWCTAAQAGDDKVAAAVAHGLAELRGGGPADTLLARLDTLEAALGPASGSVQDRYRRALIQGGRVEALDGRARIEAAGRLHEQAQAILDEAPDHGGAHHLVGRLHAGVMRLGRATRLLARLVYGGELLSRASWSAARAHLEAAERGAPCQPEHHLELARALAETGDEAGAQREVRHVLELTAPAHGTAPARAEVLRRQALALVQGS